MHFSLTFSQITIWLLLTRAGKALFPGAQSVAIPISLLGLNSNQISDPSDASFNQLQLFFIVLFIIMFMIIGILFLQNKKFLKKINSEKEEIKSHLSNRLEMVI